MAEQSLSNCKKPLKLLSRCLDTA